MISLNYIKNNIMKINKYKSSLFLLILQLFMFQFVVVAQKSTDTVAVVNKTSNAVQNIQKSAEAKKVDIAYGQLSFDAVTTSILTVSSLSNQ